MPLEILLVEDNPGDVRLMQEAVKEGGFTSRISVASDGEEAMAFLRAEGKFANRPRPDLIMLDLNLPGISGCEVLAKVKKEQELRTIPVMIFSTSIDPRDIQQAYDLHANCYIPKPCDLDELINLGKIIEGFWSVAVALPA